jgi:hypothetical protein
MKTTNFTAQVEKMRHLQREYFRTRSPYLLREAKKQERIVDKELEKMKVDTQKELF